MMKTMVDPAHGWLYGFPKEIPEDVLMSGLMHPWLLEQGYPEEYLKYPIRMWREENDKS